MWFECQKCNFYTTSLGEALAHARVVQKRFRRTEVHVVKPVEEDTLILPNREKRTRLN